MTEVFVVAPTQMMRAGLRAMLQTDDVTVVGEASQLEDAISHDADVLVVAGELVMGEAVRRDMEGQALGVVVLADDSQAVSLLRSLPLRGWGVVSSDAPALDLQAAVVAVAQGMIVFALPLADKILERHPTVQAISGETLEESLTARELAVLELLSQGLPNKQIAQALHISEHTVKFHVSSIYTKLGAASRTEAVSRGARLGLISF